MSAKYTDKQMRDSNLSTFDIYTDKQMRYVFDCTSNL